MLKIRGMDIYYIRGDDDSFSVQPTTADGTAYVLINDSVSTADKAVRDGDGNTISTTYVKVVSGKGLSTNDYTTAEKNKLAGLSNYTLPAATSSVLGGGENWKQHHRVVRRRLADVS